MNSGNTNKAVWDECGCGDTTGAIMLHHSPLLEVSDPSER
jgi:hypothetical protein